jgi:hypothetical protein
MTRKLLAGLGAAALVLSSASAFAECYSGHTASVSTPVKTAQISTPAQPSPTKSTQD